MILSESRNSKTAQKNHAFPENIQNSFLEDDARGRSDSGREPRFAFEPNIFPGRTTIPKCLRLQIQEGWADNCAFFCL